VADDVAPASGANGSVIGLAVADDGTAVAVEYGAPVPISISSPSEAGDLDAQQRWHLA